MRIHLVLALALLTLCAAAPARAIDVGYDCAEGADEDIVATKTPRGSDLAPGV